ncbi:MAG: TonB-dependent receptor [Burkholderiaceae bacterium]|jgi:iron complex outermembrane receptor protein|nr:TonB-dependent receptor [Burkholderiaceae bacterium]
MRKTRLAWALALAFPVPLLAQTPTPAETDPVEAPVKSLGVVTVHSGQPTSLPTQIPATIEGVTREQIEETVNATDSPDALKYFPSLLVRKRYIGDYNHAVLSSRASGTGNSARSAVYADGILLSNYLGNGAGYTPRWGLVTPEEIERVDVMYGPYSAAYPGNSVGAVVDYVTRMPQAFEGTAGASVFRNNFKLYGTDASYGGQQASASLGSRSGDWSWWVNLNHTDSTGQPLVFATKLVSDTTATAGTPVTGAVRAPNTTNADAWVLGTNTQYRTIQDHAKIKLAYDISPTLRASYTLGLWTNDAEGNPQTYLRDAAGNPVYTGTVQLNGQNYNIGNASFNATRERLQHVMHGLSLKSHTKEEWDWELAASLYDYARDELRRTTVTSAASFSGGAGTLADQSGTGWMTVLARGTWRPQGVQGAHIVDFGVQQDIYRLRILTSSIAGNWLSDAPGTVNSDVGGETRTQALYAQDTWTFAPRWKTVLGARLEHWNANSGTTYNSTSTPTRVDYASRSENYISPKASLAYQWSADKVLKLASGRAVRMPTVSELYGATSNPTLTLINDPNLRPEKSVTTELTLEQDLGHGLLRTTLFHENTRDALYSQLIPGSTTTSRVQNVDEIRTDGIELAYSGSGVFVRRLDLQGSLTYADSRIVSNPALPASVGKYQPRVPVWRATALASYRFDEQQSGSLGVRYSGQQYSQLTNTDVNGDAYTGASAYLVVDLRYRYRLAPRTVAALGVDNLTNRIYWNFHPYPQRTWIADLKHSF